MFVSSHRDLRRLFFTFVVVVYSVVVLSLYAVTRVYTAVIYVYCNRRALYYKL